MGAGDPLHPLIIVERTYDLAKWLEARGWEASPIFNHPKELRNRGVAVSPDKPEPDVILDFDFAAIASGLGEIGRGKFLLTKEFGPRQVFSAVITDAKLDSGKPVQLNLCDGCDKCIKVCPHQAILEEMNSIEIGESSHKWNKIRKESCLICKTGTRRNPYYDGAEPWRVGATCGRACIASLESRGKLTRKYTNPFREE
jgi:ferredoxin